jgi:hypothetical protein
MKQESARGGAWLAGAGITAVIGYLIATISVPGKHPDWPYLLFGILTVIGLIVYAVNRENYEVESKASPAKARVKSQIARVPTLPASALVGRFTDPPEGARLPIATDQIFGGEVSNVPEGVVLWVVVWDLNVNRSRLFRKVRFIDMNGSFRFRASVSMVGEALLLLVATEGGVTSRFRDLTVRLRELPEGVQIITQRRIIVGSQ